VDVSYLGQFGNDIQDQAARMSITITF